MLFNKGDRVVLRRDGKAGKVVRASDKRDEFSVAFDDGTEIDELRGSELRIEKRRESPAQENERLRAELAALKR